MSSWDDFKKVAQETVGKAPGAGQYVHVHRDSAFELIAEREALLAERDALKKDAERYRWLNNPANFHAAVSQQLWLLHGSQEFGERIDKAIGKGEQP